MSKKMTIITAVLAIVFSTGFLSIGGCEQMFAMNQTDFNNLSDGIKQLSQKTDDMQEVMKEAASSGLVNSEKVEKINANIDQYQSTIVQAADAIKGSADIISAAMSVNQATAGVNPYAGMIDLILKIIAGTMTAGTVTGAAVAVGQAKQKNAAIAEKDAAVEEKDAVVETAAVTEAKYKATNRANELLRMEHPDMAKEHYKLVGDERAKELKNLSAA